MTEHAFPADIHALAFAARAVGVPLDCTEVAETLGIPFLIVGSEEWLDRAVISLYPRMRTVIPESLVIFRRELYQRLRVRGVDVRTEWCADVDSIPTYLLELPSASVVWMCLNASDDRIPLFVAAGDDWVDATVPDERWQTTLANMHAPNGFLWIAVARCSPVRVPSITEEMRWACGLLQSQHIWRFPTPTHPLRLWQSWHVGASALEVIALAAHDAAPLSIVSDTVAAVFHHFHARAYHAQKIVHRWNNSTTISVDPSAGHALESAYADVLYLFNILTQQFPHNAPVRALTRAEGALLSEVCRDARLVYKEIIEILSLMGGVENVVGRPGFEPGTKSL